MRATRNNFLDLVTALTVLVNSYNNNCVCCLFDGLAQDPQLSQFADPARRTLESFRERWVNFLNDFDECMRGFEGSLCAARIEVPVFVRPKPI